MSVETTSAVPGGAPNGVDPSGPTKPEAPQGALTLQQAIAAQLAKSESARAPTPARPDPAAAETTNQEDASQAGGLESEPAEGVAQDEGVEGQGEQAEAAEGEPQGQQVDLTEDSEIILPNGERWSGKDLVEGLMKRADYTRKTQALQAERQTLERLTTELRSKVGQIEHDLVARHQQTEEVYKEASAKRDHYAEQLKRITDAQREHVTQWDRVDWDRLQREQPERIGPLMIQRDQARDHLAKAEAERRQLEEERRAESEQRSQQEREAYARNWVGRRQALLDHVQQQHPVFVDPQKSNGEWAKIDRTLKSVGMSDEVIQAAFGARHDPSIPLISAPIFELIRKAALYDAAVAQTRAAAPGKTSTNSQADLGKIRVVKAEAPRFRPPPPDKAALGRATAQFHRTYSLQDAKKVELAKILARRSQTG